MTQPPTSGTSDPFQSTPAGQPPYPAGSYPAPAGGTNTMAILSLIFAFVFAPLAIVFGHMAKKQIRERGEQGDGLATAGLVLGYIFTGLSVVLCLAWVALLGVGGFATTHVTTPTPAEVGR
jgi:hypothetical protein